MLEKNLKIKVSPKHFLYGKFAGSYNQPLFIIVHGLPGNMDEEFYHSAARYFFRKGFSTFRFNIYGWQKGARQLIDCTLRTHAADLDTIVKYFKNRGIGKVFVAGHSFGGPTILFSKDQNFTAAVLWDPSYDISFTKKKYGFPGGKYVPQLKGYFMKWGVNVIIGKKMADEVNSLNWKSLAVKFRSPFKIILAGKGVLVKKARAYAESARVKKDLKIIPGATHYFDDKEGMQEKVYRYSEQWFRKFM